MKTVEERLEALKETVTIQRSKINDLERALRDEQAANKVLMKLLKNKFSSGFIERVESNL